MDNQALRRRLEALCAHRVAWDRRAGCDRKWPVRFGRGRLASLARGPGYALVSRLRSAPPCTAPAIPPICCGHIARSGQVKIRSAQRSETPKHHPRA